MILYKFTIFIVLSSTLLLAQPLKNEEKLNLENVNANEFLDEKFPDLSRMMKNFRPEANSSDVKTSGKNVTELEKFNLVVNEKLKNLSTEEMKQIFGAEKMNLMQSFGLTAFITMWQAQGTTQIINEEYARLLMQKGDSDDKDTNFETPSPSDLTNDEWHKVFQKIAKFIVDPLIDIDFTARESEYASQYVYNESSREIVRQRFYQFLPRDLKWKHEADRQLALKLTKKLIKSIMADLQKNVGGYASLIFALRIRQILDVA